MMESQNCPDSIQSSEAILSHDQLITSALTSRPVVLLERLKFHADSASFHSATDRAQTTPMCIKQEPDDIKPTLQGYDAQQGLIQNNMDYKPTDIEIPASLPQELCLSEPEKTRVLCSRSYQQAVGATRCETSINIFKTNLTEGCLSQHARKIAKKSRYHSEYQTGINFSQKVPHRNLHKCDQCDYQSAKNSKLKRHLRTHTGEKPYKCEQCDYQAARTCHLRQHMRTHTGDKPYKCHRCDFRAAQKGCLKIHMRIHTGEKPYKCDQCDYRATQRITLEYHMRTHTGEKPYKCDQCDYETQQRITLTRHTITHSGEKPYKCDQCDYQTARKDNLIRHMKTHAGE